MLVFEHEQRIRALIHAFAEERDPDKLKAIAAELERLLSPESRQWLLDKKHERRGF